MKVLTPSGPATFPSSAAACGSNTTSGPSQSLAASAASVERVGPLQKSLHVLLRHRLLPQPGGFEGVGLAQEVEGCDALPLPKLHDHPGGRVKRRAAVGAVTTNRRADEHEIPNISKLLVLDLEIGEGASDFPPPLTRTFETVVLLAGARPVKLDLIRASVSAFASQASKSPRLKALFTRRTSSTFSCDIARPVSRAELSGTRHWSGGLPPLQGRSPCVSLTRCI
jgi:hypothetical protein